MAKKPEIKKQKDAGLGLGAKLILLIVLAVMALFIIPTVILLCVAMLPTFVAAITDRSISRMSWLCVGGLNFSGTVPFIADLWIRGGHMDAALSLVTDVFTIMLIYGAAGVGWLLYISVPQLLGAFMAMTATHRIATLKAQQEKLGDDWGPEVREGAEEAVAEFMRRGRVSDFNTPSG
ncbi:MAG: hypothetical protein K9H25_04015 [Rhodospirillum sp.]|nr:hypothetical protein [Rhodospirillum sp.]MCF8488838.1 hypothetical protein [Rhodospirillum sp.]MCF8501327.1 hypothetical protein [Rhodospirillum sp.]